MTENNWKILNSLENMYWIFVLILAFSFLSFLYASLTPSAPEAYIFVDMYLGNLTEAQDPDKTCLVCSLSKTIAFQ